MLNIVRAQRKASKSETCTESRHPLLFCACTADLYLNKRLSVDKQKKKKMVSQLEMDPPKILKAFRNEPSLRCSSPPASDAAHI
jgi:hypothetical protein